MSENNLEKRLNQLLSEFGEGKIAPLHGKKLEWKFGFEQEFSIFAQTKDKNKPTIMYSLA